VSDGSSDAEISDEFYQNGRIITPKIEPTDIPKKRTNKKMKGLTVSIPDKNESLLGDTIQQVSEYEENPLLFTQLNVEENNNYLRNALALTISNEEVFKVPFSTDFALPNPLQTPTAGSHFNFELMTPEGIPQKQNSFPNYYLVSPLLPMQVFTRASQASEANSNLYNSKSSPFQDIFSQPQNFLRNALPSTPIVKKEEMSSSINDNKDRFIMSPNYFFNSSHQNFPTTPFGAQGDMGQALFPACRESAEKKEQSSIDAYMQLLQDSSFPKPNLFTGKTENENRIKEEEVEEQKSGFKVKNEERRNLLVKSKKKNGYI